jgi:hypothetical protein
VRQNEKDERAGGVNGKLNSYGNNSDTSGRAIGRRT